MNIEDYISNERLKTYIDITDRKERAIALHNQTLQLGSSLMSMIALLELSFRNSTNQHLINTFGDPYWLASEDETIPIKEFEKSAVKTARTQARKAAYSKLDNDEKRALDSMAYPNGVPSEAKHKTIVKKRQSSIEISHGQIIAQTTFSFWKRLYANEYEPTLWKRSLKKVFPNKQISRSEISNALESVYVTRNRVAHHEPVYGQRLQRVMKDLEFLRNSLGAHTINEDTDFKKFSQIQHLRLRMDYESFLEAWKTLT